MYQTTKPRKVCWLILDKSDSMSNCYDATLSGYNEYLSKLKRDAGDCELFVGITIFSDEISVGPCVPIDQMVPLTRDTYRLGGMTALNDAVMRSITAVERAAREKGAETFLVCVLTDGHENASKEFPGKGNARVIEAIKTRQETCWTFTFMGADMSQQQAQAMASTLGVSVGNTLGYEKSATKEVFGRQAAVTASYLNSGERQTKGFYRPNEGDEDEPQLVGATSSGTSAKLTGS